MIFASLSFLLYFLPITIILYYLTPKQYRNVTLLISSLFFYAWGEPFYILLMLLSIIVAYFISFKIEKAENNLPLIVGVVFQLALLILFKYTKIPKSMPIGISFYTFQIISYEVDVYRKEVKANRSFINLALYISMFPQLIAGPIVRYQAIEQSLIERVENISDINAGMKRFMIGLAKKVLIANNLAIIQTINEPTVLFYWLSALAFTLQIYFDFSGYSDMAIGLGKIFGFHFMENFDYPYMSKSITEFFRRWHISLGTWFKDYVYIPLGGNRHHKVRNLLIIFGLTGIWHGYGWQFFIWGMYFGVLLVIEKYVFKLHGHLYLLISVLLSFVIFNHANFIEYFQVMFGLAGVPFNSTITMYYLKSFALMIIISIIFATPYPKMLGEKLVAFDTLFYVLIMILCLAYLVSGSFNPFLYFRF